MIAVLQIMIRMKQLLRLLNMMKTSLIKTSLLKTSLLSLEASNIMDQDYQIPVRLVELYHLQVMQLIWFLVMVGGYLTLNVSGTREMVLLINLSHSHVIFI